MDSRRVSLKEMPASAPTVLPRPSPARRANDSSHHPLLIRALARSRARGEFQSVGLQANPLPQALILYGAVGQGGKVAHGHVVPVEVVANALELLGPDPKRLDRVTARGRTSHRWSGCYPCAA